MKKLFILTCLCLLATSSIACEFCGCSSSNYFIGAFPQFKKYFVGTRYSFRKFNTTAANDPTQFSKDFYQTVELWGGVNLGSRWQVLVFLPYSINKQYSDDGTKKTNGLGDMTMIANYSVLKIKGGNGVSHQLWLGGGLKLPTGKYVLDPDALVASANNQPGSGSLDYLVNATYVLRTSFWGVNANTNYKINQSSNAFRFGNRFAASTFVFRSISTISAMFNPNLGLLYEHLMASQQYDMNVYATGGYTLLAAAGLETSVSRFAVGFNAQVPISQNMSAGQTSTKVRGMVHVTYTF